MPDAPSTRLGIIAPSDSGDAVPSWPNMIQAIRDLLDPKLVVFDQGIATSRPTSTAGSPGLKGRFWQSTDTGALDYDYGTGWLSIKAPLLATLPTAQIAGALIYYQNAAMAALVSGSTGSGGPWTLRYDQSASQWVYVAGGDYSPALSGSLVTASAAYVALTSGPSVTVPLTGSYAVDIAATVANGAAALNKTNVGLLQGGASTAVVASFNSSDLLDQSRSTMRTPAILLSAGDVLTLGCRSVSSQSTTFSAGMIAIRPNTVA